MALLVGGSWRTPPTRCRHIAVEGLNVVLRPPGEPFKSRQVQAKENGVAVLHGRCIEPLGQGEYLAGSGLDLGQRVRERRMEDAQGFNRVAGLAATPPVGGLPAVIGGIPFIYMGHFPHPSQRRHQKHQKAPPKKSTFIRILRYAVPTERKHLFFKTQTVVPQACFFAVPAVPAVPCTAGTAENPDSGTAVLPYVSSIIRAFGTEYRDFLNRLESALYT